MPFTAPYDWDAVIHFLAARATPGVESVASGVYRRTIALDGAPGMLEIRPGGSDHLQLRAHLPYWEGVIHVVERAARLVGIDAEPTLAAEQLAADATLGRLVSSRPGVRVPGAWGPFEVAVHAVVSQALCDSDARDCLGRLARCHGTAIAGLQHGLTHAFPSAEVLAKVRASEYGLPGRLGESVRSLAQAVVSGAVRLDGSESLDELVGSLLAVPAISAAAAHHVALRLGARDAFPLTDAKVQRALQRLGVRPGDLEAAAASWRPWRALATVHLLLEDRRQAVPDRRTRDQRNRSFSSPYAIASSSAP